MQCRMDKKNLLAPQNLIGEAIISLHVAYTCTARAQSFKTEDFFYKSAFVFAEFKIQYVVDGVQTQKLQNGN